MAYKNKPPKTKRVHTSVAGKGVAKVVSGPSKKFNVKTQSNKSYPSMDAKKRGAASKATAPSGPAKPWAQGGEKEGSSLSAGKSRVRSGKNRIPSGQQAMRG